MTSTSSAVRQLSDGNGAQGGPGTAMGTGATDKIGFYTSSITGPIVQPAGNQQAAVTRGQACGRIGTFSSTQSPASCTANTSVEVSMTVQSGTGGAFLAASGDVIYLNKPTSQAGLGLGNVRYSSSGVLGVTFNNFTGSNLTPTSSQLYSGVILRGFNSLTTTISPAAVLKQTIVEQQFNVTGLRVNELVQVSKPTSQAGLDIVGCRVVSNNVLGITFANLTASTVTPTASEAYTVMCLGGLDAVNNEMEVQVNIGTALAAGVATITTSEIAPIPLANLATTDTVKGVSKDTQQAGLGIAGYRVTGAGNLGIAWINPTAATLTPTASHVYQVSLSRPNPVAPLLLYTPTLTPVSVAANTTAEQTFTVTGLIAGSPVWLNKPSYTQGLGIVGVRVSAANTLAINFGNVTAAAITPPAEQYIVGNFQLPFDTADGILYLQTAAGVSQQQSILSNAIRQALVNLGLAAGA